MDPEHVSEDLPRSLAGFLVHFRDEIGQFWPLYQGRNWVGRSGGEDIDVPLDDPATSSKHALILAAARPGRLKVEDLGSTNGTYVGRHRLERGQRRELTDGDLLRFGTVTCIVKIV
jgi:pSer/pThr/pTyr-binding forkhead associated (FHA) protein